jgi:MYXO-CTERM domain-containing protein
MPATAIAPAPAETTASAAIATAAALLAAARRRRRYCCRRGKLNRNTCRSSHSLRMNDRPDRADVTRLTHARQTSFGLGHESTADLGANLAAQRWDRLSCLHARWASRSDPSDSGPAARTGWLGSPVRWQRASESLRRPRTQCEGPRHRDLRPDGDRTKREAESWGTPSRRRARPRPGACVESLGEDWARVGPRWPTTREGQPAHMRARKRENGGFAGIAC